MIIWPATRFVAGETVEGAYERLEELNDFGARGMIDDLGEHVEDEEAAIEARDTYLDILETIDARGLDGSISVKPTHLGLEVDEELCQDNLEALAEKADELDLFLWVDMESSQHTDETVEIYLDLLDVTDRVGVCIQCYLKRSDDDLDRIINEGGKVRLVKGAYDEPEEIAYESKKQVDINYRKLMEKLFRQQARFAVATHDRELVERAKELYEEHEPEDFEFQFLKGLRDDMKHDLVEEGYTVSEYIPYGDDWMAYYWRRVMERKENLFFAVKALVGR
ncbi:MAG: proline dehydrogenase family protein [Candidatus Nanohaloarchaea archaeon]|nr:proline dehydrogenase family protein [Candidatus Nanohaloarchaea archaeon]